MLSLNHDNFSSIYIGCLFSNRYTLVPIVSAVQTKGNSMEMAVQINLEENQPYFTCNGWDKAKV